MQRQPLGGLVSHWPGSLSTDEAQDSDGQETKLSIRPAAETAGLTLQSLGRQLRQALYGEEAQRIQRDPDDVRVMVRYPRDERRSPGDAAALDRQLARGVRMVGIGSTHKRKSRNAWNARTTVGSCKASRAR